MTREQTRSDKANQSAKRRDKNPKTHSEIPTHFCRKQCDTIGGGSAADIGAGVEYARYGGNLTPSLEIGRKHCREHQVGAVHSTNEKSEGKNGENDATSTQQEEYDGGYGADEEENASERGRVFNLPLVEECRKSDANHTENGHNHARKNGKDTTDIIGL